MNFAKYKPKATQESDFVDEQEISISDIMNICKKYIKLIISVFVACVLCSTIFCFLILKNKYTSFVSMTTASQQLSNDIIALVKTDKVLDAVSDAIGIDNINNNFKIEVTTNDKNRLAKISVTGANPDDVAEVANNIAKQTSKTAKDTLKGDTTINIIEEAYPSYTPSGPPRLKYILITCILGLGAAIAYIVIKEFWGSKKVKNENDIKKIVGYPVLSQIPYFKQPTIK